MKKIKKISFVYLLMMILIVSGYMNIQAASLNDGLGTDITVTSGQNDSADLEIYIKNANYYAIDGMNYKIQVTGDAVLSGDLENTDFKLNGNETKIIKAQVKSTKQPAENPTENPTEGTVNNSEEKPGTDSSAQSDNNSVFASDNENIAQTAKNSEDGVAVNTAKVDTKTNVTTGDTNNAWIYIILGNSAFLIILFIAFKKKNKKIISMMLCVIMVSSAISMPLCNVSAAESTENVTDVSTKVITETKNITLGEQTVVITVTVRYPEQAEIHDNTLEDLKAKNGDSLDIVYNANNEISFLNGSYTDYKVVNWETAMTSLQAVESLLDLDDKDLTLMPIFQKEDDNGDTYYTFQQTEGNIVLSEAFITIGADKDGNTLCISNSLNTTNIEDDMTDINITAEQAEDLVFSKYFPNLEKVDKEPTLDYYILDSVLCWVVYAKSNENNELEPGKTEYYKIHLSVTDGKYYSRDLVSDIYDYRTENISYSNDVYFVGVETEMMTFTDYQGKSVELPVAKNDEGKYYFVDTERRIFCTDQSSVEASCGLSIQQYTFDSPSDVSPIDVSIFENMRNVYDNYKAYGIESIDGNGLPLLLCFDYRKNGEPCQNACFKPISSGWGIFYFGRYPVATALDVAAHEYTHGIKHCITGPAVYCNVTGAIEESYADILGNLTEMIVDPEYSDTETWLVGETSGTPIRCMGNPNLYFQPEYAGDAYYMMSNGYNGEDLGDINDHGGVHINNSILSYICYQMNEEGISMEDNYSLWLDTFMIFNKNADYKDVCAYLKYMAARHNKSDYISIINSLFEEANISDVNSLTWEDIQPLEGFTKISINVENVPEDIIWLGVIRNNNNHTFIDKDIRGEYAAVVENGSYRLAIFYQENIDASIGVRYFYPVNSEGVNVTLTGGTVNLTVDYNDMIPI